MCLAKQILMGDALSQASVPIAQEDITIIPINMINFIAVTPKRYTEFQSKTADELLEGSHTILKGWPDNKQDAAASVREYWTIRDQLLLLLLLRMTRPGI